MSRIFFERKDAEPTIFMQPFSSLLCPPDEVKFTNSNIPFTNLTYYKAGNKVNGEERFKSYFSVNANKRLAFGFNIDYLYGRGILSEPVHPPTSMPECLPATSAINTKCRQCTTTSP